MSVCRSCGAEIRWAKTTGGKPIPVDPEPAENGNLALETVRGELMAFPASLFVEPDELHVSHFATCPNADEHRKPK